MKLCKSTKFPVCFPPNFESEILPKNLLPLSLDVYRVCTNGMINKDSFRSTYEITLAGERPKPPDWEERLSDPSTYSVSCFNQKKPAKNILKCLTGYYPAAILAKGTASSTDGPIQRSQDRDKTMQKNHYDWWLYNESDPSSHFEKVEMQGEKECEGI